MFSTHDSSGYKDPLPGIRQKTLAYGEKTLMVEFRLKHPQEQTGCLVSGWLDLTIDNETRRHGPGDSWCIPGNTEYGAKPIENSVAVEMFASLRDDYLPREGTA